VVFAGDAGGRVPPAATEEADPLVDCERQAAEISAKTMLKRRTRTIGALRLAGNLGEVRLGAQILT
jgi:hypothetical protein